MRLSFTKLPKNHIGLPKRRNLPLKVGELLKARVLKAGSNRALLNIKGQQILAEVKTPLQPGDEINFRVAGEFKNKVVLKILQESTTNSNPVEQLLTRFGIKSDPEARTALAFLLKNNLPLTPDTLRVMINQEKNPLGQLLFQSLGQSQKTPTLKNPQTAGIAQQLEEQGLAIHPGRDRSHLAKSIKVLAQSLELIRAKSPIEKKAQQKPPLLSLVEETLETKSKEVTREMMDKFIGLKLRQKEDQLLLHLEIPLLFEEPTTGVLEIREETGHQQQQETDQKPLQIYFNLELESLGKIRILLLQAGNEMNCQFSASSEKTRKLLRKSLPDLKERLIEMDYQIQGMGVTTLQMEEERPEPLPGQVDFRV